MQSQGYGADVLLMFGQHLVISSLQIGKFFMFKQVQFSLSLPHVKGEIP
jgi:hypothetical protein